jgi:tetratricopeptide (TPR) repeat protein
LILWTSYDQLSFQSKDRIEKSYRAVEFGFSRQEASQSVAERQSPIDRPVAKQSSHQGGGECFQLHQCLCQLKHRRFPFDVEPGPAGGIVSTRLFSPKLLRLSFHRGCTGIQPNAFRGICLAAESDSDAAIFGLLVRQAREAHGWSQEALAAAAFSGSMNKGYISRIENGKVPGITRETVRSIARALGIDPEEIPPALRWPLATDVVKDTNTVAHEIKEQLDKLIAAKEDQARAFGIKEGMLIALARRYAEGSPGDFDAALAGLERALEVARDERERGRLSSNVSEAIDAVIARIDALNQSGDLEAGQAALDAELAAFDEEDHRRRAMRARFYEKGLAQAILTRSVENACRFVVAQIDLDLSAASEDRYGLFRAEFDKWYRRGSDKGLNFDLEVAIALAREGLDRAKNLNHRGAMRNMLGVALLALGARESGKARLEEAVVAYRMALKEHRRGWMPISWAGTQNNLGNVLMALGRRESETTRFEEAVVAYRAALEERTRERVPLEWAATQSNLGNALAILGQRESGTVRLKEAVVAYRAALEERTRERVAVKWAETQNNLGNVLLVLGQRENETTRLEESVVAHRACLEEKIRERVPLGWATAQNNLGNALAALGQRESGTVRLKEAVAAYRAALEEGTRERVPLDWASTQYNLGITLLALGKRGSGRARLDEAVMACRQALDEWTRERVPLSWAATQCNLGNSLLALGERENGTESLGEAVVAYRLALEEWTRERVPLEWAGTQNNLGCALVTLGERESSTERVNEAIRAYYAAMEERTRERVPFAWAETQYNLGYALSILGKWENGTTWLEAAIQAYRAALEESTRERVPWLQALQERLEKTLAELKRRQSS